MEYWFHFFSGLCLFLVLVYIFMPYGGTWFFELITQRGLFDAPENAPKAFRVTNRFLGYLYLGNLFCGLLIPLAYKMNARLKYKIGIVCGLSVIVITLTGSRLLGVIFY